MGQGSCFTVVHKLFFVTIAGEGRETAETGIVEPRAFTQLLALCRITWRAKCARKVAKFESSLKHEGKLVTASRVRYAQKYFAQLLLPLSPALSSPFWAHRCRNITPTCR